MIDKELVEAFVQEYKQEQEWKKRYKKNFIEFEDFFKYSGKIEETKVLISHWKYDHNHRCNDLHEQYINKKDYEKLWEENKSNACRFTEELAAYNWNETENSVWCDKD